MLRPIAERAEWILREMENRNTTGLAAMDYLVALAKDKEEAVATANASGLSPRAFGVYWSLKDDEALAKAGISAADLAKDSEALLTRFPNAQVNDDEQRRLRAALYRPLVSSRSSDAGQMRRSMISAVRVG